MKPYVFLNQGVFGSLGSRQRGGGGSCLGISVRARRLALEVQAAGALRFWATSGVWGLGFNLESSSQKGFRVLQSLLKKGL